MTHQPKMTTSLAHAETYHANTAATKNNLTNTQQQITTSRQNRHCGSNETNLADAAETKPTSPTPR